MATNKMTPMGKISDLKSAGERFGHTDVRAGDPVRACEVCGKERASSDMINLIIVIGSPGHYSLAPFQHPETEHWACSLDCWDKLVDSVGKQMSALLRQKHWHTHDSIHNVKPEFPGAQNVQK